MRVHYSSDFITFFVCILHKFAYSETKQDGLEFQILGTIWLLDFTDLSRLIPMSFLSVLSVFVDFPFWMRLGVRYHCYYLYSVVCQQIWRNVLPLFFSRYTGVKKTQHYKLFISNPIVLFWRTKTKPNSNITGRTVSALLTEELLEKIMLAKTKHKKLWKFYWNPFCCLGRVMDNATVSSLYCIALYDNYIALNDKVQKWRNFSKNC